MAEQIVDKIIHNTNSLLQQGLFLPTISNLEWSRGYTWFVELDDVPYPFQRGGVIGLPVTDITFEIANGKEYTWNSGITAFNVPESNPLGTVSVTMLDDENATILTFFERWYNAIYNRKAGVLPVTECVKCISIYKLRSIRTRVGRTIFNYNRTDGTRTAARTDSRDLLVYPVSNLQENEKTQSDPRSYTIFFNIVDQLDDDYGNPATHEILNSYKKQEEEEMLSLGSNFLTKAVSFL